MKHEADKLAYRDKTNSEIVNGSRITKRPNGEVEIDLDPDLMEIPIATSSYNPKDHFGNLVEILDDATKSSIAGTLVDRVNDEIESVRLRQGMIAKAIELGGQQPEDRSDYPFKGASKVYDPTFQECSTSICSTVRRELFPAQGPVEIRNFGSPDPELVEKSQLVKDYMNYILTVENKSYVNESMKCIKWAVETGSCFKKIFVDPLRGKISQNIIEFDDFIIDSKAPTFEKATMIVQKFRVSAKNLRMMQLDGFFLDVKLKTWQDSSNSDSTLKDALRERSGIEDTSLNDNNEYYELWECHVDLDVKGLEHKNDDGQPTGLPLPYLVTFEPESRQILRFCRNWKKDDKSYGRINIFVHYFPSEGYDIYGEGLLQKIGNLARSATNMTRISQNASYLASHPGGLRVKSLRNEGNQKNIGPGEFVEIDTGGLPLSEAIMAMPYKDASPMMIQMIEALQTSMKNIAGAAMMNHQDFDPNAPVGTTLALLEKINVVSSSVMTNFYNSLAEELQIIFELLKEILPEEPIRFKHNGEFKNISAKDFDDDVSIVPISDPNLNSSAQRLIVAQELRRMSIESPDLLDSRKITEKICREMKIDPSHIMTANPDDEKEAEVIPLDPISENLNIMADKPVKASIMQDNEAHLAVHTQLEQQLMQDPENNANKLAALKAHKQEHQIFIYQLQMEQMIGQQLPDDPSQLPLEVQNQFAMQAAQAVQQQQQQEAENAPPPPLDPATVMLEDVKVKAQLGEQRSHIDQLKIELDTMKVQEDSKHREQNYQLELFQAQSKDELERARDELKRLQAESQHQMDMMKMEYESKIKDQELQLKKIQLELNINKAKNDHSIAINDRINSQENVD